MSGLSLQQKVQKNLGIKYVAAKTLVDQSISELDGNEKDYDDDVIIDRSAALFRSLSKKEQDDMKVGNHSIDAAINSNHKQEPDWKRKARLLAEKREAEWKASQQSQNNTSDDCENSETLKQQQLNDTPLQPGQTKVTSTTTTTTTSTTTITSSKPIIKEGKWRSIKKDNMPESFNQNDDKKFKASTYLCSIM